MPISIACPSCGAKLKAPDHLAGRTLACPKCRTLVTVPGPAPADRQGAVLAPQPAATPRKPQPASAATAAPVEIPVQVVQAVPTAAATPAVQPAPAAGVPCPYCREPIQPDAKKCRHCGELLDPELREGAAGRGAADVPTGMVLGMLGAILLGAGFHAPVLSAPVVGNLSFYEFNTHGIDATETAIGVASLVMVGVTALLAFVLAACRRYRPLGVVGLLALAPIAYAAIRLFLRLQNAAELAAGNQFGQAVVGAMSWQWGWAVLGLGVLLLLMASAAPTKPAKG